MAEWKRGALTASRRQTKFNTIGFPGTREVEISERVRHIGQTGSHIFLLLFNGQNNPQNGRRFKFCMFVCKLVALKHWHYHNKVRWKQWRTPKMHVKVPSNRLRSSKNEKWAEWKQKQKVKRITKFKFMSMKCNVSSMTPQQISLAKFCAPKIRAHSFVQTFTFIKTWMDISQVIILTLAF